MVWRPRLVLYASTRQTKLAQLVLLGVRFVTGRSAIYRTLGGRVQGVLLAYVLVYPTVETEALNFEWLMGLGSGALDSWQSLRQSTTAPVLAGRSECKLQPRMAGRSNPAGDTCSNRFSQHCIARLNQKLTQRGAWAPATTKDFPISLPWPPNCQAPLCVSVPPGLHTTMAASRVILKHPHPKPTNHNVQNRL